MVQYRLLLENGTSFCFSVDRQRDAGKANGSKTHADWTRLEYHQCTECPFSAADCHFCPAALDIEDIATRFESVGSIERARVEVETPERTYVKDCDVQTALRSLLGLVMATSGCPIFSQFKHLASMHLPFATVEETLFRTVGAYLLKQYFVYQAGCRPDLEMKGLAEFYEKLQSVNQAFNKRLVAAQGKDANLNAVVALTCLSMGVSYSLEERLAELRGLFCPD